jgi:hypothetical protein
LDLAEIHVATRAALIIVGAGENSADGRDWAAAPTFLRMRRCAGRAPLLRSLPWRFRLRSSRTIRQQGFFIRSEFKVAKGMNDFSAFKLIDLVLAVPLTISAAYAGYSRYRENTWEIRKAALLGFSLPLALIYTAVLWVSPYPNLTFMDNFSWQVSTLIFGAPQSIALYIIGFFAWARVGQKLRINMLLFSAFVILVAGGHIWTRMFLSSP